MNKITGLRPAMILSFNIFRKVKSTTLVELMLSIIIVSTMVLSFYTLESFSHKQVLNADRRVKVQNELAYCLEHMSKYVRQAGGNATLNAGANYPAILLYPTTGTKTGFQARVDLNSPQTPADFSDDAMVYYRLEGNQLITGCTGACGSLGTSEETLSNRIVANFNNSVLPVIPPYSASDGFYVWIDSAANYVDVGLVGRYYPTQVPTVNTKLTNPQVAMKTRLICNNSSSN